MNVNQENELLGLRTGLSTFTEKPREQREQREPRQPRQPREEKPVEKTE